MCISGSHLGAVPDKLAFDRHLEERGHPYRALVAFSGTVKDPETGKAYTEAGMNGFPDTRTAEAFKGDERRFLIVANKFQTGFDQPLLHTMYVDRKLSGVHAVQSLSRLNRTHPRKEETMVLDFANEAEAIQKAFEPYYDRTLLEEGTDPNLLYDLEQRLEGFHLYTSNEMDAFARVYFGEGETQAKLYGALEPVVDRYKGADGEEQRDFRTTLQDYVRKYAFLSQVIRFTDADLEKLYHFGRYLRKLLPVEENRLPKEVLRNVDLESYRLQKTREEENIGLEGGQGSLSPLGAGPFGAAADEELEPLSEIIRALNDRFGTDFSEEDRVTLEALQESVFNDPRVRQSYRINTRENARLTFNQVLEEQLQKTLDSNFRFYKQVADDERFATFFIDTLFERFVKAVGDDGGAAE